MRRALTIIAIVVCGVIGAWVGYWIGHAVGWSENAVWPWTIGGGTGSILLSIAVSVLFVALAAVALFLVPQRGVRRTLRTGTPASAVVLGAEETGAVAWNPRGTRRQIRCELEITPPAGPPYRATSTQFVTEAAEKRLRPGTTVAIRYDPAEPTRVALENLTERAA
jgi:hypothetical protein